MAENGGGRTEVLVPPGARSSVFETHLVDLEPLRVRRVERRAVGRAGALREIRHNRANLMNPLSSNNPSASSHPTRTSKE